MTDRNDQFAIGEFYRDAVENIRFAKLQQWRVTNYALLIYAGAYFLRDKPPLDTCGGKAVLSVIVTTSWLFSIVVLCMLESSMSKFRDRIAWFYERYFTPDERIALKMESKTFWFDPTIFIGLMLASTVGATLVFTILWLSQKPG